MFLGVPGWFSGIRGRQSLEKFRFFWWWWTAVSTTTHPTTGSPFCTPSPTHKWNG